MVNPLYLFSIALGAAFLLSIFDRRGRHVSLSVFMLALLAMTTISGSWMGLVWGQKVSFATAGFAPPFSINLQIGPEEAFFAFFTNLAGLLGGLFLLRKFREHGVSGMILFLMMIMGVNGIILTRDLFNLFVFMEISSIATYSILGIEQNSRSLSAGFKYLIAGGLATFFFLIGTIFIYHLTGTLNIDGMIASQQLFVGKSGFIAVFLLLFAILLELKPFPANGWALDVYQAAPSGIVAIIAVVNSGGMLFALYKIVPLATKCLPCIAAIGLVTFLFSNVLGLKQTDAKRLLGYSSIGQMGLIISTLAIVSQFPNPSMYLPLIVGGLFLNHFIAKAGLFWLAGMIQQTRIQDWGKGLTGVEWSDKKISAGWFHQQITRHIPATIVHPVFLAIFGSFLFALAGFPPFPGFWAKWELVCQLAAHGMGRWIGLILLGSLLEAVYLLRWFGYAVHNVRATASHQGDGTEKSASPSTSLQALDLIKVVPVAGFALLLYSAGWTTSSLAKGIAPAVILPLVISAIWFLFDYQLSIKMRGLLTMLLVALFSAVLLPKLSGIPLMFGIIFLLGSVVQLIATLELSPDEQRGVSRRIGFYPLLLLLILSLGMLLVSKTTLEFFYCWELMTVSSYLLILRGKKAMQPALHYIIFSTAGAFLLLAGFGFAAKETGDLLFSSFNLLGRLTPHIYMVLVAGFLVKTGAIGVHVWLPGAYAEAEDTVSSLVSSVLSKVGIFGLFMVTMAMGSQFFGHVYLAYILGWIGVLTALFGALMAVFQEDVKPMLAYSSMGQLGYIVLAFAITSHLGWTTALYLSVTHLLFKAMLFLAVAGVILRTNTRNMYEMGGLIKQMPFSFVSVLIAIIAVSGVPPLSGFGGKWLLYSALFEKGWYGHLAVAFFSGGIAFLYLFRLIYTIFLGQPKPTLQHVTEAPAAFLVPQYIFLIAIMAISTFPSVILKPLSSAVDLYYASTLTWEGFTLKSSLGYWNGLAVMSVTMIIFAIPLIWLLVMMRKPQEVKQFNIVYAAERPDRPETTHFAHNFFAHYQRALGFMVTPLATRFWSAVAEGVHSLAGAIRRIYTGNGQTYALHIMLFLLAFYLLVK